MPDATNRSRAKALVRYFNNQFGRKYRYSNMDYPAVVFVAELLEKGGEKTTVSGIQKALMILLTSGKDDLNLEDTFKLAFEMVGTPTPAPKDMTAYLVDQYLPQIVDDVIKLVQEKTRPLKREISFEYKGKPINVGLAHEQFETVSILIQAQEPVMLVGPAGTGKNHLVKQVADALEMDFYFTNSVTQEYKLTGFIDAGGRYHETEFYKAFTKGGIFMLDEVDASIPEALIIMNAALANRYFPFPCGHREAHPDFRVVAAGNTYGSGGDEIYVRNQLDGATLNRFAVVYVDYSPAIEQGLTEDQELLQFIRAFRQACVKSDIQRVVSYRDITRIEKLRHSPLSLETVMEISLLKGIGTDELRSVKTNMGQLPVSNKYLRAI